MNTKRILKSNSLIKAKNKGKAPNGFVLYDGASVLDPSQDVIVIATLSSANVKTGNMIQTWILVKDYAPVEASKMGVDEIICGNCPIVTSIMALAM